MVGSKQVSLSGKFTILPPAVKLAQRADNLVTVSGRFVSELHLEGAGQRLWRRAHFHAGAGGVDPGAARDPGQFAPYHG